LTSRSSLPRLSTCKSPIPTKAPSKPEIIVGRPKIFIQPDLSLAPDVTVSRTHARIFERDGNDWIEDLARKYKTLP
jgi:hypothetical protein